MAFQEIIARKRDGYQLSRHEIEELVSGYTDGSIPDYQVSAILMAICLKGMDVEETYYLTDAMLKSGETLDLSGLGGAKIDKHSTGGVGDKVSLALAPIAASCGLVVPMISGRGLGHTGGTLDKLESIPGYRTDLSVSDFRSVLSKCGASIIGQTSDVAPADKKLYALRDVTATVESIPLITASILSKKLASGIDGIVFDIKCGSGAFMKTFDDAASLAKSLVDTAKRFDKKCRALITGMDEPLGNAVGNSLEVMESIDYLRGNFISDLHEITVSLGAQMLIIGEVELSEDKARQMIEDSISSGKALDVFKRMVELQHGDQRIIDDNSLLDLAETKDEFLSPSDGYISEIETRDVGLAANALGAGRQRIEDSVDFGVGFNFRKKTGDKVSKDEPIAEIFARNITDIAMAKDKLQRAVEISPEKPPTDGKVLRLIE
ncbi:MAG: thymidine phosphorylase [candidate division Zixibacteria bacterium]|nr:thymidine phosphorylase [candidate division Zixibacteria bacterium]